METNYDTSSPDVGRLVMRALCDLDARLVPEQVSISDEFRDAFLGVDNFARHWWAQEAEMRLGGRLLASII